MQARDGLVSKRDPSLPFVARGADPGRMVNLS